ncbi:hypothetical protein RI065_00710 [Mycoplasmatota bacterium zrk1]
MHGCDKKTVTESTYDDMGNLVLEKIIDSDGIVVGYTSHNYEYYDNGEIRIHSYENYEGELIVISEGLSYDETRELTSNSKNEWEYDEDGNCDIWMHSSYDIRRLSTWYEIREFNDLKQLIKFEYYKYDEEGNMFQHNELVYQYHSNNVPSTITLYEYDGDDKLKKKISTYDENSKLISEEHYHCNNVPSTITLYEYDGDNKLIRTIRSVYDEDGKLINESQKKHN